MRKTLITFAIGSLLTLPAWAQSPYMEPDDTWMTLSGTVHSTDDDGFMLDYGDGVLEVEVERRDDTAVSSLQRGDKVTVTGVIDDDLFETTSLEASGVYVERLDSYFLSSAANETDLFYGTGDPIEMSRTIARGTVTSIDGNEIMIDSDMRSFSVDLSGLSDDPLDDEGQPRVDVGDRVLVSGEMTPQFFDVRRELTADAIAVIDGDGR